MIASARSAYILKRLAECGIIDYKNISKELDVSEATVRRDFEKLEMKGQLRRVQGGAIINEEARYGELSIRAKSNVNAAEKQKIAEEASKCVEDGESVFLDCGTSIAPIAQILLRKKIHIVTNNNLIFQQVAANTAAEIFVVGGRLVPADHMFVGPMAEAMLACFTFNKAFIGCMGLNLEHDSVYVTDMDSLGIKKLAMQNAQTKILLLDTSKLNKHGLFKVAGTADFDRIYIDEGGPEEKYPENFVQVKI